MPRRFLLVCGIAAPVVYVLADALAALRWSAYSYTTQTISELSAIGAPTRDFLIPFYVPYDALLIAFAVGLWRAAGRARGLRVTAALLLGLVVVGTLMTPMHQRTDLAISGHELTDIGHLIGAAAYTLFIPILIGFGATAFGKRFRLYSAATIVVLLVCGTLTWLAVPRVEADQPTPWLGVMERINVFGFMLWNAVLAVALLRSSTRGAEHRESAPTSELSRPTPFKSPEGRAAYLAAYDKAMKAWPGQYQDLDIPTRFGPTHVVVSGRADGAPLVFLHGYWATSTMWAVNVGDFSKDYRVYAVDVMGQPSKTIPREPVRSPQDYVMWLTEVLDGLHLTRASLVGMSYGGWLAMQFALAAPDRVTKLVLLSPGGFLPMVRQFFVRGMLMLFLPTHMTVNSFMGWLGLTAADGNVLDLMYLGLKHFRIPPETAQVMSNALSDDELRSLNAPTLLLFGEREIIYDPAAALARARRLMPDVEGELIPACRHDMCFRQHQLVDARVLGFLKQTRAAGERVVA